MKNNAFINQCIDRLNTLLTFDTNKKERYLNQFKNYLLNLEDKFNRIDCKNREHWLEERKKGIGGSSCSSILGLNPYQTNIQYWEIKTGLKEAEDISNKPAVLYGSNAEDNIRNMFALDYKDYMCVYHNPYEILFRKDKPYLMASLDGEIIVIRDCIVCGKRLKAGMRGILEIKTCEPMRSRTLESWKQDNVPENYHCQRLHYLNVSDYDFHILRCDFRLYDNELKSWKHWSKDYCILKNEVKDQLSFIEEKETYFWEEYITKKVRPNLILDI